MSGFVFVLLLSVGGTLFSMAYYRVTSVSHPFSGRFLPLNAEDVSFCFLYLLTLIIVVIIVYTLCTASNIVYLMLLLFSLGFFSLRGRVRKKVYCNS